MAEFKNELVLQDASGVKVSIDLRNALVLSAAPTSATKARQGMQAYVVSGGAITAEYVCTAVSGGVYTWVLREGPGQEESGETFVATYGVTTYADVKAAVDAKKAVFAYYSDDMYCFSNAVNNAIQFTRIVTGAKNAYFVNVKNDNTWSVTSHGLQKTENLVSSIGASSSDTQYPSAKAVYNFVMANGSGGGAGGTFVAVYGETPYADVRAAYEAGQTVIVMEGTKVYHLSQVGTSLMRFDYVDSLVHSRVTVTSGIGWTKSETEITGSETGEESYRFLKTITTTEEVAEISETFSVGYDGVIVTVENITIASGNLQLYVTAGKDPTMRGVGASLKTNSVLRFICRKLNGTWDVFGYQGLAGDASTMIGQIGANAVSAVSATALEGFSTVFDNINKIRVYTYSGRTLPEGMTIKIFVLGGDDNA